jgi:epoxyqueuosine reductase
MDRQKLTDALRREAHRLGFELAGVCQAVVPPGLDRFRGWLAAGYAGEMDYLADRAAAYEHPRHVLEGVQSLLMLGMNYHTGPAAAAERGQGRVARYSWGRDYHEVIRQRLHRLADFHRQLTPGVSVRGVVDTAPLLEREFAQLAGLGWIGKNTLLVNRQLGSWFFLAALLTTEPLVPDPAYAGDFCGQCRACLDACPTGALVDAYRLDARRCISYLTVELRGSVPREGRVDLGDWVFGCDLCQEACPWNRRAPATLEPAFRPAADRDPLELAPLFALDDNAFRERFRHTPLWRPKRRGLLRSAAIAMGNRPQASAIAPLAAGLNDPEPLVRAACAWALGRHEGCEAAAALCAQLAIETDSEVRHEIESANNRPQ